MRSRRRTSLVVACAFVGGCSLTTDLTGFSTGAPAPRPAPAARAGAEAGPDAPAAGLDGSTESGSPDAAAPFCVAGAHAFCDDFDTGKPLANWDAPNVAPNGSLGVSTVRAKSAPQALLSTLDRRGQGAPYATATISKTFTGARHVVVEFDVFLEAPAFAANDVNSGIFSTSWYSGPGSAGISLSVGDNYTTLGNPGMEANSAGLVTGTWQHARFDVDPAGRVVASIGDVRWDATFPAYSAGDNPTTRVELGVNGYNQPAPAYRIFYDNVTIDLP